MRIDYIIGMGSNVGDRMANLRGARDAIARLADASLVGQSPVYCSDAVGPPQPDYLNAAVRVLSPQAPPQLLVQLHAIEAAHGRVRRVRWGPRTLDLDILWSSVPVDDAGLRVPHPELRARWFALRPLLDVAPELSDVYGADLRALGQVPPPHPDPL